MSSQGIAGPVVALPLLELPVDEPVDAAVVEAEPVPETWVVDPVAAEVEEKAVAALVEDDEVSTLVVAGFDVDSGPSKSGFISGHPASAKAANVHGNLMASSVAGLAPPASRQVLGDFDVGPVGCRAPRIRGDNRPQLHQTAPWEAILSTRALRRKV